jgi:hypothetical protein
LRDESLATWTEDTGGCEEWLRLLGARGGTGPAFTMRPAQFLLPDLKET